MGVEIFSSVSPEELQTALENKLFRGILDTMLNGVQVLKALRDKKNEITDFKYLFVNNAAENFAGKKITGKKLSSLFKDENKHPFFEKLVNVVNTGAPENFLDYFENGVQKTFHYTIHKFSDGVLITQEDIMEQKNAEEKITNLNKELSIKNRELEALNSELKTFNTIAATDYKETLRTLYTNLEYVIKKDARNLSDTSKANIRRAQTAIQKMKLLTDDIVGFSRIKALEQDISEVDLNELLQAILNDLSNKIQESGARIESETLPVVVGYPLLLSLLFSHLLDNAIKFRKQDMMTFIQISYSKETELAFNDANAYDISYYVISIIDNGIGFEQKQAEKIFHMFYRLHDRSKYKGSGIGLAICKKIMSLHDGFITAESDPGKGSTFHCFFPTKNK